MLRDRLPHARAILQVYAVIAVLLAAWTITAFLWKLSAWLLLLNLEEIFAIFSYAMTANFVESLIILAIVLVACLLLPPRFLRDDFVVRGTVLSAGLILALMAFVGAHMRFGIESGAWLWFPPVVMLILTGVLVKLSSKGDAIRSVALWFSDRVLVFLFLLIPLFLSLSIYVAVRNII